MCLTFRSIIYPFLHPVLKTFLDRQKEKSTSIREVEKTNSMSLSLSLSFALSGFVQGLVLHGARPYNYAIT